MNTIALIRPDSGTEVILKSSIQVPPINTKLQFMGRTYVVEDIEGELEEQYGLIDDISYRIFAYEEINENNK